MSVGKVRVGVAAVEVGAGNTVLCGVAQSKLLLEDGLSVGTSDAVKTVEEDLEVGVGGEELLDKVEVEDVLEHGNVVGSAVDNLDLEVAVGLGTNIGDVDIRNVGNLVGSQSLGELVNLVGNGLGGRATVGEVVLDTEVILGACWWSDIVSMLGL